MLWSKGNTWEPIWSLGSLEGSLEDESKNAAVDWSSPPIYDDRPNDIQEGKLVEITKEDKIAAFQVPPTLLEKIDKEFWESKNDF